MAIDGVAPRAKLNQQRSRRFRSARDLAEATADMKEEAGGKKKEVFDSNCITPGTEFLAKVSVTIQYFIRKKIKEDPLWHGLTVIFSGHDVPGEGEHKIMQHIREMRNQPTYQPNTRHCIYGQDADLIMLGLVTHEPHFTILREVIDFNFNFNNKNSLKAVKKFTKESDFQLLHLSVLREYLEIEFCYQQPQWNLERVIDDFVFMTFLVGNDFLPVRLVGCLVLWISTWVCLSFGLVVATCRLTLLLCFLSRYSTCHRWILEMVPLTCSLISIENSETTGARATT